MLFNNLALRIERYIDNRLSDLSVHISDLFRQHAVPAEAPRLEAKTRAFRTFLVEAFRILSDSSPLLNEQMLEAVPQMAQDVRDMARKHSASLRELESVLYEWNDAQEPMETLAELLRRAEWLYRVREALTTPPDNDSRAEIALDQLPRVAGETIRELHQTRSTANMQCARLMLLYKALGFSEVFDNFENVLAEAKRLYAEATKEPEA